MAACTRRTESAPESAFTEVIAGVGIIGDPIGITESYFTIAIGITLRAIRFITATTTTEAETHAADLTATGPNIVPATTKRIGLSAGTAPSADATSALPAQRPGLLKRTVTLLEDTLNLAAKAVPAQ